MWDVIPTGSVNTARWHLSLVGQKVLAYAQPYRPEIASSFLREMKQF